MKSKQRLSATMHTRNKRHTLVGFIVLLGQLLSSIVNLSAQDTPEVNASIRILLNHYVPPIALRSGDEMPLEYQSHSTEYYYRSPDGYRSITIDDNSISRSIEYQGPLQFVLYERTITDGGESNYRPQLVSQLPVNSDNTYLLLGDGGAQASVTQLSAIPIEPSQIPHDHILGYNLGNRPLQIVTKEQRISLQPKESALIHISDNQAMQFRIMAAISEEDSYKLVYRRNWSVKSNRRAICIFYPTNKEMTQWNSRLIPLPAQ